jgi:segregation and condensation protein A
MSMQVAGFQSETYTINTPVYEGPLDLLLSLIERAELDITSLALAQVTDQYLAHIRTLDNRNPAEVSAFLVIAAKLVQIKSEALLPRPVNLQPSEEDAGTNLAHQLIVYRRFKQLANWLGEREEANLQTFLHIPPHIHIEARPDLTGLGLPDLIQAARTAYAPHLSRPFLSTVVSIPLVTIRDKIRAIIHTLKENRRITFKSILGQTYNRIDVVVTFLAMLELVKRHVVETRQEDVFAEIELEPIQEVNEADDYSLEFLE